MADSSLEGHLHRGCGGRYALGAETVALRVSGMTARVERAFFRCAKCGDEQRTVEQREAAEQAAVAGLRAQHGLLAPKGIRQLRERLGLTSAQLGELLYGVPAGVVEGWERGRYLQNRDADALLRSLEDRDELERRAAKAGVVLPVPADSSSSSPGSEGSAASDASATHGSQAPPPRARDLAEAPLESHAGE
jgi:putative zinc finger/helix-turn-helix YgiT family protein